MKKKMMLTGLMVLIAAMVAMAQCPADCKCAGCAAKAAEKAVLCEKCGEVKGAEKCCKPDAEKCSACGLHKGSPGCCAKKK